MIQKIIKNKWKILISIFIFLSVGLLLGGILFLFILTLIDISNLVIENINISNFLFHMNETYWLALWGFLITLSTAIFVPLAFFLIGERHRKEDKKESDKEFQIVYATNEKQFICNFILNWEDFRLVKTLSNYLYGNISNRDVFLNEIIKYTDKSYRDINRKFMSKMNDFYSKFPQQMKEKAIKINELNVEIAKELCDNDINRYDELKVQLADVTYTITTEYELSEYKKIVIEESLRVSNDLELAIILCSLTTDEEVRQKLIVLQRLLVKHAKGLNKIVKEVEVGSKIYRRENDK